MDAIPESLEFKDVEFDDDRLVGIKMNQKEFPGRKAQSLNEFKSLIMGSTDLHPCLEDNFLLRFLRGAKHRPKTALKRLERYYHYRNLHPEIFQNYLPSNTVSAQALNHIKAISHRAYNLSPVVVIKLGLTNFERVKFEELLRLDLLIFETLLLNPVTQLTGITIIIDFNGFSHAELGKLVMWLPTCYHVFHSYCTLRLKYIHVVNTPALLYLLYQNLLSEKPQERVVFYPVDSKLEELHNQVSLDHLPEEYGGKLSYSSLADLSPIVNEKESYFQELLKYGVNK